MTLKHTTSQRFDATLKGIPKSVKRVTLIFEAEHPLGPLFPRLRIDTSRIDVERLRRSFAPHLESLEVTQKRLKMQFNHLYVKKENHLFSGRYASIWDYQYETES